MSTENKACEVCEKPLVPIWTDHHGVASCHSCGTPYRIFKYDGDKRSVVCELLTKPKWVPMIKRYHQETGQRAPHGFDFVMNFPTYSGLTRADYDAWNTWTEVNKKELDRLAGEEAK